MPHSQHTPVSVIITPSRVFCPCLHAMLLVPSPLSAPFTRPCGLRTGGSTQSKLQASEFLFSVALHLSLVLAFLLAVIDSIRVEQAPPIAHVRSKLPGGATLRELHVMPHKPCAPCF